MSLSSWRVVLVSTGYDMPDLRADLGEFLTKSGFVVLAYERAGFPVQPYVHSHDACLLTIDQADVVVLIIDQRYGGMYLGKGPFSITEEEYNRAVEQQKVIIPCVRKRAWDERHQLFQAVEALRAKGHADPRSVLPLTYVKDWEVLDFIERVRKAAKDNFVIMFDDLPELRQRLEERLRGLSLWLLQRLVRDQIRQVKAMKTTTAMTFSLGDVLAQGYFAEPRFTMKAGTPSPGDTPSSILRRIPASNACAAILGEPGVGKSTLLGKAFLEHARESLDRRASSLPFFVSLRGRGGFAFDYQAYVNECFATSERKAPYPLLALENAQPTFYLDGFDEMSEDQPGIEVSQFCRSTIYNFPFVLACRSRYASEFLNQTALGDRLTDVIELAPWDTTMVSQYIETFCRIRSCPDLIAGLKTAFASADEMSEIAGNPLLLTLFLCLVAESGMTVPLDVRNKRALLSKTIENWAWRELGRVQDATGVSLAQQNSLLRAWRVAAWHVYRSRFENAPPLRMDALLAVVKTLVPEAASVCKREAFAGIFDIRPQTDEITGLIHELLLEELVAEIISEAMRGEAYPFLDSLGVAIRWEINQLIRSIWTEAAAETLNTTLDNLVKAFNDTLSDNSPSGILRRNQAAYYMGRLDIPAAGTALRQADAKETNLFVKLSLGFGLMKRQQFDVEDAIVRKLSQDKDWDNGNRGYHLFYYRDWHVRDIAPPYMDPGNVPWPNTLRALLRHIESTSEKHIALRRVELLTLRRLIETRGARGPLTADIFARIETAVKATTQAHDPSLPVEFEQNLEKEYVALEAAWLAVQ